MVVLSIEGAQVHTDTRRGKGIFDHLQGVIAKLSEHKMFWGVSITVTSENLETVSSPAFMKRLVNQGCKLVFLVEYVPVTEGTDSLTLAPDARKKLLATVEQFRKSLPAIFIAFPGDEEMFGGCLSAGRGFVHVNPAGGLEPCPFAPYSDASVAGGSLQEALQSKLLATIRENHEQLKETAGGCALWEKREWVAELAKPS